MPVSGVGSGVDYGNTVFTDKKSNDKVSADDFLQLMIAQLKNQDFMNPVDDTQYVAQLAQFTTMQQMTELAESAKQSYILSMVGQTVTAAKFKVNGEIDTATGVIDKISLVEGENLIYIGDKSFTLDQIMELHAPEASSPSGDSDSGEDYSQSGFLISLIGKNVTVENDDDEEITGNVEKISMNDGFKFMIDGEWYTLDQLVTVSPSNEKDEASDSADTSGDDTSTTQPDEGIEA